MPDPIIILILAVVLIAVVAVLLIKPGQKRDVRSMYTEGLDHLLRGNLQKAYKCFRGVIEKDTDHIAAYIKMGQALRTGEAYDQALKLHESLLARTDLADYELFELYKNLALDHAQLGNYTKAVEWCKALLKLDKRNTWALRHLVKFYGQQTDWISAGKYLTRWQKVKKISDTRLVAFCRFRQGYDHRNSDAPDEIRDHYRHALKIDASFAPANYFLGKSYAKEGDILRKKLDALTNGSSDPKDDKLKKNLNEKIGVLYPKAIASWSSFVDQSPRDTYLVLNKVEEILFYLQRFDDVEPFLKQIIERDPRNLDVLAGLANFYVRKGELDKAGQLLSSLPEDATNGPLIQAIRIKLDYRKDQERNLMPELDDLVDAIRESVVSLSGSSSTVPSLMSWLEPDHDPLEKLA
ncbi:tetratricopeptide repeat protein [Candidatus Neomarinimicrobiota bacterium]